MTLSEAQRLLPTRPCDACGAPAQLADELNNGGRYVTCSFCPRKHAWTGVQYLKVTDKVTRRTPDTHTVSSVWTTADTRCVICDRTHAEISTLHVGIQVHHSPRYAVAEHDGMALPICIECHGLVNWRQRLIDRERKTLRIVAGGDA